jgi:hypothetical protein
MTFSRSAWLLHVLACSAALPLAGCSSSSAPEAFNSPVVATPRPTLPDGSVDDASRCEWRGRQDREVIETAGAGAILPNVRRVYAVVGQGPDRQRALVCREVDTNLDGVKDVVRTYNDKGESLHEEADTNHDGRIDTWLTFAKGRLAEAKLDRNHDGNPDEWKLYSDGKLLRVRRDTTGDGKADRWELYGEGGKLERIGVDVDGDERVDRWDHDTELKRAREDKERAEEEAAARKAAEKAEAERKAGEYDAADPKAEGGGSKP